MQQIADWLEKLGLSEYAQRFAENDIDFTILPDLTDQDLKELGVRSAIVASCCVRSPISEPSRRARFQSPLQYPPHRCRLILPSAARSR